MTYIPLSHIKLFASRIYCSGGAGAAQKLRELQRWRRSNPASPAFDVLVSSRGPYVSIILDSRSNVNGEKPGILFKIGPRRFLPAALR